MTRFIKTRKEDIGLSPAALNFRGEIKSEHVLLRIIDYNPDFIEEIVLNEVDEAICYDHPGSISWFNLDGVHDDKIMEEISVGLHLDSIILSDVMNTHSRPKVLEYEDYIYISVKMLQYDNFNDVVSAENLVVILKKNMLLSFQEKQGNVFQPLRERLRNSKRRIRNAGTDYLAFAILDIVFDNYAYIVGSIGEKIEVLEVKLLNNPQRSILEEINNLKREIVFLRKSIKPCHDLTMQLLKLESELIDSSVYVHFRELQDNITQINESLDSYREILTDQLTLYHTAMSTKLNDIMKFLTVFSVIFIPLTFIAGVYGTNFDNIPELHQKYGYFVMLFVMISIAIGMIFYFRKKDWL